MLSSWHSPSFLCLFAASLPLLAGCQAEQPREPRTKQIFHLREFEKNFGCAQAVQVERTLYISSSVAVDAQGRLVAPGDLKGQLHASSTRVSSSPFRQPRNCRSGSGLALFVLSGLPLSPFSDGAQTQIPQTRHHFTTRGTLQRAGSAFCYT